MAQVSTRRERRLRAAAAVTLVCGLFAACAAKQPIEVLYFFSAVCPACEESQRAIRGSASAAHAGSRDRGIRVRVYDVYHDEAAMDAFIEAVDRHRVPVERQGLPLLIVNGTTYSGLDEVEPALAELLSARRR